MRRITPAVFLLALLQVGCLDEEPTPERPKPGQPEPAPQEEPDLLLSDGDGDIPGGGGDEDPCGLREPRSNLAADDDPCTPGT